MTTVEEEVAFTTATLTANSTSLTTEVAVAATVEHVPALSRGRFIVVANVDTLVASLAGYVGDASHAGSSFISTNYVLGSAVHLANLGVSSTMTNASQQVSMGMIFPAGNATLELYVQGYTFSRRFAGT